MASNRPLPTSTRLIASAARRRRKGRTGRRSTGTSPSSSLTGYCRRTWRSTSCSARCATHWRASTASPRDPSLADRRFHPRGWVALCEGTGVRPVDDEAITFFHSSSGKVRRVDLWELQGQRIVGFTDGLILMLDTSTSVVRVLHPFTRVMVRLPHLVSFLHYVISKQPSLTMESFLWLGAAV